MFGLPVSGVTLDQQHNAGKLPLCLTRSSAFRASIFHQLPSRVHKTLLGLSKQAGTHSTARGWQFEVIGAADISPHQPAGLCNGDN